MGCVSQRGGNGIFPHVMYYRGYPGYLYSDKPMDLARNQFSIHYIAMQLRYFPRLLSFE